MSPTAWLVVLLLSQPGPAQRPVPSGLLLSCFSAGSMASWGVYEFGPDWHLRLLLRGGRSPAWSRDRSRWVCYRNGELWQSTGGRPETTGFGCGPPQGRRFAVPLGDDPESFAILSPCRSAVPRSHAPLSIYTGSDKARTWAARSRSFDVYHAVAEAVERDLGVWVDPMLVGLPRPRLLVDLLDLDASPDGSKLAIAAGTATDMGPVESHVYVCDLNSLAVARIGPRDPSRSEANPRWLDEDTISFEAVSVSALERRTWIEDVSSGDRRLLEVRQPEGIKPRLSPMLDVASVQVMAVSPDGSLLAVSFRTPWRCQTRPHGLALLDRDGAVVGVSEISSAVADVAWSPDGERLACVTGPPYGPSGACADSGWRLHIARGRDASDAITEYGPDSPRDPRDDVLCPYEVAW